MFIAQHSVLVPSSTSSFQRRRVKNPRVALWHLLNEEEEEKGTAASALFSRRKTDRPVGGHLLVAKAITFLWRKKGICPLLTKNKNMSKTSPSHEASARRLKYFRKYKCSECAKVVKSPPVSIDFTPVQSARREMEGGRRRRRTRNEKRTSKKRSGRENLSWHFVRSKRGEKETFPGNRHAYVCPFPPSLPSCIWTFSFSFSGLFFLMASRPSYSQIEAGRTFPTPPSSATHLFLADGRSAIIIGRLGCMCRAIMEQ